MQHHGAGLRRLVEDPHFVQALVTDWRAACGADVRLSALLAYAERLTREPMSVTEDDIARLRDAGLDDEAILHACEVTAYFNYVNRIADGLGVQLEEDWSLPILRLPGRATQGSDP